jgi:hypothetical protein
MTDIQLRRAHLLALAADCKRKANKLFADRKNRHDAERYLKLGAVYQEMADWVERDSK